MSFTTPGDVDHAIGGAKIGKTTVTLETPETRRVVPWRRRKDSLRS